MVKVAYFPPHNYLLTLIAAPPTVESELLQACLRWSPLSLLTKLALACVSRSRGSLDAIPYSMTDTPHPMEAHPLPMKIRLPVRSVRSHLSVFSLTVP